MCCSGSNSSNDAETFDDGSFTASEHKCSELNFRRLRVEGDNFVVVIVLPLLTYVDDDFNDDLLAELDEEAVLVDNSPTQRTEYIVVVISERSKCIETFLLCARFVLVINACKDYSEKDCHFRGRKMSRF